MIGIQTGDGTRAAADGPSQCNIGDWVRVAEIVEVGKAASADVAAIYGDWAYCAPVAF